MGQATLINLLLRNYLHYNLYDQALLFVEYSTKDVSVGYPRLRARKEKTPVGHLRIFHPRAVVDLLSKCGFRICSVHAAEFTALPRWMRVIDCIIGRCLPDAGSTSIVCAEKLKS